MTSMLITTLRWLTMQNIAMHKCTLHIEVRDTTVECGLLTRLFLLLPTLALFWA